LSTIPCCRASQGAVHGASSRAVVGSRGTNLSAADSEEEAPQAKGFFLYVYVIFPANLVPTFARVLVWLVCAEIDAFEPLV
jgi:hypothetical protein